MRPIRLLAALLLIALAGCASYGPREHGYYRDGSGGDYYHGYEDAPSRWTFGVGYGAGWYDPYDALFWGVRYSYWDPFWFPYFHYGVTWYPRWYYGGYAGWRGWHPYSPWYGSWWDHYYAWERTPRRPGYRGGGNPSLDPQRYGSARNAAERMAASRRGLDGLGRYDSGVVVGRPAGVRWQRDDVPVGTPGLAPGRPVDRFPQRRGDPLPSSRRDWPAAGSSGFPPPASGRGGRDTGPAPARRGDLPSRPVLAPSPSRSFEGAGRADRGGPAARPAPPQRSGSLQRDPPARDRD